MIEIPIPVRADLDRGIKKTFLDSVFATEDNKAHRFDVSLYKNQEALDLPSGAAVSAYFMRYGDNGTVMLDGTVSGNVVSVTLKKACYQKSGAFALVIKALSGDEVTTVFYGEGSMYASRTDIIIDDEHIIPSLDDLLAQIATMEAATQAAQEATSKANSAGDKANTAADRANAEATAAQGWASATATAKTLEAGSDAAVSLTTKNGSKNIEFSIPRGNPGVYIGPDEPTDPTIDVWIDSDGEADELPGGLTEEEIQNAVNNYLEDHPVSPGVTKDEVQTAVNTALAQAKASGEFDGKDGATGPAGQDYVLTDADKREIAGMVEVTGGGTGGGTAEVYVGPEAPTDPNIKIWIDNDADDGDKLATMNDVKSYVEEAILGGAW